MDTDSTQPEHILDSYYMRGRHVFDLGTLDPTRRDFFTRWEKLKTLIFLGEIFKPKWKMADPTRAEQQNIDLTWVKKFWSGHITSEYHKYESKKSEKPHTHALKREKVSLSNP